MNDELDRFLDQFYGKYAPDSIPQGERRASLKKKLSEDFDGYVTQMYTKYSPENVPTGERMASLRTKYLKKEPTGLEVAGALVGGFNRGLSQAISAPIKAGGAIQRTIAGALGYPSEAPLPGIPGVANLEQAGSDIDKFNEVVNPRYENVNETAQAVTEGLGQGAAMLATAGASAPGMVAPTVTQAVTRQLTSTPSVLGGLMTGVPEYEAARAAGSSDVEAFKSLLKNYAVGQTEALPIQNLIGRLSKAAGKPFWETLKASGAGSVEEFLQEGIQTYFTNQFAKEDYDPERDPMFQVLESAKVGGIVGAILPGFAGAAKFAPDAIRKKFEKKLEPTMTSETLNEVVGETDKAIASLPVDQQVAAQQDAMFSEVTGETLPQPESLSQNENTIVEPIGQESQPQVSEVPQQELSPESNVPSATPTLPAFNETPEWIFADQAVKAATETFRNEDSPENFAALQEAIQQRDNARIEFEKRTPQREREYQRVTKFNVWKEKFKNINRGIRQGTTDTKEAFRQLGKDISEFMEGQNLTTAQQNAILRRTTGVNISNPLQVEKLFKYVNNITQDAAYDEKINKIKTVRNAVKSRVRSGKFAQETPDVKRIVSIDPETLPANLLPEYTEVIDGLNKKVPDPRALRASVERLESAATMEEVANFQTPQEVAQYVESIPQVTDFESFKAAKRSLSQARRKLQQLASQETYDETEMEKFSQGIDFIDQRLNSQIQSFENEAEGFKTQRIAEAKQVLSTPGEFTPLVKEKVDEFIKIPKSDLDRMSPAEVENYYQISEGIANGFVNKSFYDFLVNYNKAKNIESLKGIVDEALTEFGKVRSFFGLFNTKGINPATDPQKLLNELKLLHSQRWDRKFLLGKDRPIWTKIFGPINKKVQQSQVAINKLGKEISKIDAKEDTRLKFGMLMAQIDHESNLKEGQPKDRFKYLFNLYPEKNNALEDAKPVLGIATLDKYRKIYDSLSKTNGEIDVEKNLNAMSPKERSQFNDYRKVFENQDLQDKIRVNNESRGQVVDNVKNPFPRMVRQRVRSGKDAGSTESFVDAIMNLDNKNLGVRSDRTYSRTDGIYFTELDVEKVARKLVEETNRDFYLTDVIRENVGALNKAANEVEGDGRGMMDSMENALKDRIVTEYNLKYGERGSVDNFIDWYLGFRRTMALANPLRVPYDFTANIFRQMITNGADVRAALNPTYTEIMKDNDSVMLGRTNKYAQEFTRPDETKGQQWASTLMGLGDLPVVRISYVTNFNERFKKLTGEDFDPESYKLENYREKFRKEIKDASGYAEASVQDLFNSQTTFNAPSKTKITPFDKNLTDKRSIPAKIFGFMQSFTTNESAEILQSMGDLAYGTNEGRVKAARRIAALSFSNYAYMNGALVMLNMLQAAFDDEKELEDLLKEQFSLDKQSKILLASIGSLAVGRYGNLLRPILTLVLADFQDFLNRGEFDNKEDLQGDLDVVSDITNTTFFTGKPINLVKDRPEKTLKLIPVLGEAMGDLITTGRSVNDLMLKDVETMSDQERASYDLAIMLNKIAAFVYTNPASPTIDRVLRAKKFATKKTEAVDSNLPQIPVIEPSTPSFPNVAPTNSPL